MLTALYITILLIGIFTYARIVRDHRVYGKLLLCAIVAFLIGSCVKSKAINTTSEIKTTVVASNPTAQLVFTADCLEQNVEEPSFTEPSKELKSDTTTIVIDRKIKNISKDVAIEDDS